MMLMKKLIQRLREVSKLMAMLMALNIVEGRYTYNRVPKLLKDQVDEQLLVMGYKMVDGNLVPVEE